MHQLRSYMNSFNNTEAAVFPCSLFFLRAFPFISLICIFRIYLILASFLSSISSISCHKIRLLAYSFTSSKLVNVSLMSILELILTQCRTVVKKNFTLICFPNRTQNLNNLPLTSKKIVPLAVSFKL